MRTYDPEQPVIFSHMPKCGGSAFIRLLREWFGSGYHKLNQDETQDTLLPRIATQDADGHWLADVHCIHGHFDNGRGYGLPYYYPEINQYFTILRDPFDIAVSMFFFCKQRSREGKFWYRGRQENILDKYPDVEYYLREYPYWIYNHLPQDLNGQNLEERMSERFVYVGVQEDMPTTINRLAGIFGKWDAALPRFNESDYDEPVPGWLRDRFYENYPLLKKIYDFALRNYNRSDYVTLPPRSRPAPAGSRGGDMKAWKPPAADGASPASTASVPEKVQ